MWWWWGPLCSRPTSWAGFIVLAHWNNSPRVDMSLHSGTLFWFEANQYLTRLAQALVSFKKYMPPPLPYFKVNICPFPIPHFASIFFTYLWSFRGPNYTPEIFLFMTATFKYTYRAPLRRIGQEYSANVACFISNQRLWNW